MTTETSLITTADAPPLAAMNAGVDDDLLIAMWLRSKESARTREEYGRDVERFRRFVSKPLRAVGLNDLQSYADELTHSYKTGSQQRMLASVKSLFTFGHRLGYLPFDVGKAMKLPKQKDNLAQRLLSEEEMAAMIALEPSPRNKLLIRALYVSAGRISEVLGLNWSDLQPREEGGQVTLYGKGGKTRAVLIQARLWADLMEARGGEEDDEPVFRSRLKKRLSKAQAWRIVRAAAKRAGIKGNVSPHWMRHAHASHALERGASLALVGATLGHASIATTGKYTHARPSDSSSRLLAIG